MRNPRKVLPSEADLGPATPDPLWGELGALPATLLPDLPVPVTLWLTVEGSPAAVQLTTGQHPPAESSLSEVVVFDREELRALVTAVQADRVWRKELLVMCFDKWRRPDYRLTTEDALAGANADSQDWSLRRVLARLGANLERIELGECDRDRTAWPKAA